VPRPTCSECNHPRPERHKTKCTIGLDELFDTIDERRNLLSLTPQKLGIGEGGSHEFESKPPINLTTRAHQDPASLPFPVGPDDVDRPTLSVSRTLTGWLLISERAGGHFRDGPWVMHQPWVGEMVADLRRLAGQLMAATGDPPPNPIGFCTRELWAGGTLIVDENDEPLTCGEPLFMPDTGVDGEPREADASVADLPEIECPHPECDMVYTAAALLRLKLAAEADRKRRPVALRSSIEGVPQRAGYGLARDWYYLTTEAYDARESA
jgi:hypothetical protein